MPARRCWSNGAHAIRRPRVNVTGFVARDEHGLPTTLGRNGSDYSAAIFASLFDADELHIWSDVDGVLSADPRIVPEAVPLTAMSYREACELAYFGAKVIHPQTMTPAIARGLPILMRNTFRPDFPGTRIDADGDRSAAGPVKGLTLGGELALVCLEGAGLIGVPGTAERVFAALRAAHISVVMISQGSSEHSICCVVHQREAAAARDALREAFVRELAGAQVQGVTMLAGVSVLAAVGDGMAGTPGVAARMFDALARARVNIRAIAQGASERNISVAIDSADAARALRAVHAAFWLSPQTICAGGDRPRQGRQRPARPAAGGAAAAARTAQHRPAPARAGQPQLAVAVRPRRRHRLARTHAGGAVRGWSGHASPRICWMRTCRMR